MRKVSYRHLGLRDNRTRTLLLIKIMAKYYKVTIDDEVFDEGLTYREACRLAEALDNSSRYFRRTVDVVPMED